MTRSIEFDAFLDRLEPGDGEGDLPVALLVVGQGPSFLLPASLLPPGASEGSHIHVVLTLDEARRQALGDRVAALQAELIARSGQTDRSSGGS